MKWNELVMAHLFLGKSRTDTKNVNDIALYDAYVRELTSTKGIKLFAFTLALLLLLCQTLVTKRVC